MMREASRVKAATSSRLASIVMGMASTVMTGMVLSFKKVFDTQNYCAERFGKLSVFCRISAYLSLKLKLTNF